ERARRFKARPGFRHFFAIPSTVTDARSFVSFFFELSWTHGWAFPDKPGCTSEEAHAELAKWVEHDAFRITVELLQEMVALRAGRVPNPNLAGSSHEAVYARQWFSKIQPLADEAPAA